MGISDVLLAVLLVLASALCAAGVWAAVAAARASDSLRVLAEDLDERVVPLLEKADVTIDAINAELLRVDAIVSRIEDVTDRVESTSRTVQGVANAPAEIVTDLAERVRRAWKQKRHQAPTEDSGRPSSSGADTTADRPTNGDDTST